MGMFIAGVAVTIGLELFIISVGYLSGVISFEVLR